MVQATNAVPHSPPSFRSASSDYPPISSEQEMRQSSVCQRMAMIDRRMRKLNDKYFPKANTTLRDDQRLIISTTAYEEAWYVRGHLITLLAYTTPSTIIVLHLNANSTYTTDEISSFYSLAPRRLILNHIRYPVRAYHGTLLRALLGNVEEVRRIGLSFGYVLLMCSNAWLVRGGIEKWIGRYKASLTKEMNPDEVYEDQSGKIAKAYEWAGMRLVVRQGLPNPETMFQTKHEGSFFPAKMINGLIDRFDAYLDGDDVSMLSLMCTVDTYLEEFVIPTWVEANLDKIENIPGRRYPPLVRMSTSSHGYQLEENVAVEKDEIARSLPYPHIFGIKAVGRSVVDYHGTRRDIMNRIMRKNGRARGVVHRLEDELRKAILREEWVPEEIQSKAF